MYQVYQVYQVYQKDQDQISGATYISEVVFGIKLRLCYFLRFSVSAVSDESYPVMKVIIVKRSDDLLRFALAMFYFIHTPYYTLLACGIALSPTI